MCKICGENHSTQTHPSYKVVQKLNDKKFPTHSKHYPTAHEEADKIEKKMFGSKQYNSLKDIASELHKHELMGKNKKNGKIEISQKVPKKYRQEVAFHEKVENIILRKK